VADRADIEQKDAIVAAFLRLVAERPFSEVTVRAIAEEAGVSLAVLNRHFATRGAILRAFSHGIDQAVLAADVSDMADEAPRDRLFDILMTRLDALAPHREALRGLMAAARRDPQLALTLNGIATGSLTWMLAAAGVSVRGWRGRIAVESLAFSYAKVVRVFLSEEDPGMPRTMAALDEALKQLEARHARLARLFGPAVSAERAAPPPEPAPEPEPEVAPAVDAEAPDAPLAQDETAAPEPQKPRRARAKPKSRARTSRTSAKDEPDQP